MVRASSRDLRRDVRAVAAQVCLRVARGRTEQRLLLRGDDDLRKMGERFILGWPEPAPARRRSSLAG